jgi:hypothetical protein
MTFSTPNALIGVKLWTCIICHIILLGDFNAKVGREDIFKPTIGNESLHQDSNDNGVRVVNFAHIKESSC